MANTQQTSNENENERFDLHEVTEVGEQVKARVDEAGEKMRSTLKGMNVDEATVPDAFRRVPKIITPRVHSWLDLAVTGYFLAAGAWFVSRGKKGAATAAFINAGMVASVSLMTDYEGTRKKPISFKIHGTLDALQATTAALAPVLHGFTGKPEAAFFYGQAANELAVIASTDWDAGMPKSKRRKAA